MRSRAAVRLAVRLAAAAILATALTGCTSASGACVAPTLEAPTEVAPGETVTVRLKYAFETCHDTGQRGRERPFPNADLVLKAGGETLELAEDEVSDDGTVTFEVTIPTEAAPGPATLSSPKVSSQEQLITITTP